VRKVFPPTFSQTTPASQRGYLMIVVIIMIVVIGFLGLVVTNMFFSSSFSSAANYQSAQALYLAEAGLEHATHKLLETTIANRLTCAGYGTTPLTNTLGAGSYSVSGVLNFAGDNAAPGTLTAALTAAATTIPVSNTTDYANSGRIMIDSEYINYASKSSTSFNNVTRGVDGTTATTHASGAPAGQFQCTLTSLGGVPNVTTPAGQRALQETITTQEAWTVGDVSGGNFTLGRFNNPAETAWYKYTLTGGSSLYGVYMNSYADVWIVGASALVVHWNGNAFSTATLTPNVSYRTVWCTASYVCFAGGDTSGNATVIQNYNGTAWAKATISGSSINTNIKSIQCTASNNCWAVGDNPTATFSYFYSWNGTTWTAVNENALTAYPYDGVFCNTATDCWAVGSTANFARKNGANWANLATGLPSTQYLGIYCNSTNDCWAVGQNNAGKDLIVHWNGSAWSRDASNPTPVANLNAVTCANTNDCWAVGAAVTGGLPVFVHYDGTGWTQFTNINSGPFTASALHAVTMVSPSAQPWAAWQENFS
jgi:Tfp pilus assembly protein PilX